jgi:hypothetical protein
VVEKVILDTLQKTGEEFDVTFSQGYGPVDIDSDIEGKRAPLPWFSQLLRSYRL